MEIVDAASGVVLVPIKEDVEIAVRNLHRTIQTSKNLTMQSFPNATKAALHHALPD